MVFVKCLVSTGLSLVSLWSVCPLSAGWASLVPVCGGAQPQLMLNRANGDEAKCSYASCDGPVHCLLCFISLVPYLIPTSILYENTPFWINKSLFLKCVVWMQPCAVESLYRAADIPCLYILPVAFSSLYLEGGFIWKFWASDFMLFDSASSFVVTMRQSSSRCGTMTEFHAVTGSVSFTHFLSCSF